VRGAPSARAWQAILAGAVGGAATVAGIAVFLPRLVLGELSAVNVAGALVAIAGVVLLGLMVGITFRGRPPLVKALAIPLAFALVQWVVVPAVGAGVATNTPRDTIPGAGATAVAGARDVVFRAADGVRLEGWYAPGRNGGAVVLAHGSHGDRADTLAHLRVVARAGYAVLAYDARGHGRSAGRTNALGWQGADDVAGAFRFLRRQPGVDPSRIAMLGLSMGGEEALRAAAAGVPLSAVIADGAGASTSDDRRLIPAGALSPIDVSSTWLMMRLVERISAAEEPAPLKDVVSRIRVPVLLIASHRTGERAIGLAFRRRIGGHAALWYVGDARHAEALRRHPTAYARHVVAFLRGAEREARTPIATSATAP
jgi:pimeloyl-ACP methyl ester carboxylesterase